MSSGSGSEGLASGVGQIHLSTERDWNHRPPIAYGKEFGPIHLLAENLPHDLEDLVNALPEWQRNMPVVRLAFESAISENTVDDEPDAPPIEVRNDVDDEITPPWEFHYSNRMWHGKGVPPPDVKNLRGCDCVGACNPKSLTCACVKRQRKFFKDEPGFSGFMYDEKGRLHLEYAGYPIFECNDLCQCTDDCRNRVAQLGRKCMVDIVKTPNKGWGIFARHKIVKGTYVGIYAGELLKDDEGEERGKIYNQFGRTYLFDIDFWYIRKAKGKHGADWQPYTVDAYHAGNNHSCDPNCLINACYINEANIDKPLMTLFTQRDINENEELTFSYYGDPDDDAVPVAAGAGSSGADSVYRRCECGAPKCRGRLFN
ncbi:SET domain-containing protein [Rickenella mellea]|uniref:SET domain-containing protein n=1 Tax=Rickenella mellea TaxID=50990 RepID=A0A4Y7Q435_9AGAM|nr:SET domain-containing protein [Rickenella mellea]